MTEEHKGLPVHGYVAQAADKVREVNTNKELEERLLRKLDVMARENKITYETPSGNAATVDAYDRRWIAIARTHFEQGFMALNRAIFQPQRVSLPEDNSVTKSPD